MQAEESATPKQKTCLLEWHVFILYECTPYCRSGSTGHEEIREWPGRACCGPRCCLYSAWLFSLQFFFLISSLPDSNLEVDLCIELGDFFETRESLLNGNHPDKFPPPPIQGPFRCCILGHIDWAAQFPAVSGQIIPPWETKNQRDRASPILHQRKDGSSVELLLWVYCA